MVDENIVIFHHDCEGAVNHWSIVGELVRCKDCKRFNAELGTCPEVDNPLINYLKPDDYCSRGERKESKE